MKRRRTHYNSKLRERARSLRHNSTLAEILLWKQLKGRRMLGFDFHRQKPIGKYIVDFFCRRLQLVIEIDGSTHNERLEYDAARQAYLEALGFHVIRYQDTEVKQNLQGVLLAIENWIVENQPRND